MGGRGDSAGAAFWHDLLLWQMSHVPFYLVLCLCLIWYPLCPPPRHKLIATLRCDVIHHILLPSSPSYSWIFPSSYEEPTVPRLTPNAAKAVVHFVSVRICIGEPAVSGCSWSHSRYGMDVQQDVLWPQRPEQEVRIITEKVDFLCSEQCWRMHL